MSSQSTKIWEQANLTTHELNKNYTVKMIVSEWEKSSERVIHVIFLSFASCESHEDHVKVCERILVTFPN